VGPVPKGVLPAVTRVEWVAFLRLRLYALYDGDTTVYDNLVRFHSEWWNDIGTALRRLDDCLPDLRDADHRLADHIGSDKAGGYLSGLRTLAAELGLERFGAIGTPPVTIVGYLPSGLAQSHRFLWHLDKALLWEGQKGGSERVGRPVIRPTFVMLAAFGTPIRQVDTRIAGTGYAWDPREETRVDARRRIRRSTTLAPGSIEAELERIAQEGAYLFPDQSSQRGGIYRLERDAQWVWWRLRRRWTYERIAREWDWLHAGDIRLQLQTRADEPDETARRFESENPGVAGEMTIPAQATSQIRKAVTTFAARAAVNAATGPGRLGTLEVG